MLIYIGMYVYFISTYLFTCSASARLNLLTVKNVTCSLHVLYHNVHLLNLLGEDRIQVGRGRTDQVSVIEVFECSPA